MLYSLSCGFRYFANGSQLQCRGNSALLDTEHAHGSAQLSSNLLLLYQTAIGQIHRRFHHPYRSVSCIDTFNSILVSHVLLYRFADRSRPHSSIDNLAHLENRPTTTFTTAQSYSLRRTRKIQMPGASLVYSISHNNFKTIAESPYKRHRHFSGPTSST